MSPYNDCGVLSIEPGWATLGYSWTKKQEDALKTAHNSWPGLMAISAIAAPVMLHWKSRPQSKVTV